MNNTDDILKTEYSEEFDKFRKNRMKVSFFKYGPAAINYGEHLVSAIENLEIRLKKYKETGNTEYLVDVANMAMIEFMYPQHPEAHFKGTDNEDKLKGITVKDLENM